MIPPYSTLKKERLKGKKHVKTLRAFLSSLDVEEMLSIERMIRDRERTINSSTSQKALGRQIAKSLIKNYS